MDDMATVTSTAMTVEEFSRLPGDGTRHEINAGELITLPPPKSMHSRLTRAVFIAMHAVFEKEGLREVYMEAGYVLSREPLTIRQPDGSVLAKERVEATGEDNYFDGAPELAVEIVSPSDSAQDLEAKVQQYLKGGAKSVWVLYPKTQDVCIWNANGANVFVGDDVLPLLGIAASQLFGESYPAA